MFSSCVDDEVRGVVFVCKPTLQPLLVPPSSHADYVALIIPEGEGLSRFVRDGNDFARERDVGEMIVYIDISPAIFHRRFEGGYSPYPHVNCHSFGKSVTSSLPPLYPHWQQHSCVDLFIQSRADRFRRRPSASSA